MLTFRYKKMDTCISPLPGVNSKGEVAGGALEKWPKRALVVPPRITRGSVPGLTPDKFHEDNKLWSERVDYYKKLIPPLAKGRYRNVMECWNGVLRSCFDEVSSLGDECGTLRLCL
jgi:hypothetical protein